MHGLGIRKEFSKKNCFKKDQIDCNYYCYYIFAECVNHKIVP